MLPYDKFGKIQFEHRANIDGITMNPSKWSVKIMALFKRRAKEFVCPAFLRPRPPVQEGVEAPEGVLRWINCVSELQCTGSLFIV